MALDQLEAGYLESGETERQVVACRVGDEVYGIDIANIHTIITPQPITFVPRTPSFVRGVMNLRGRVLPVIDLRTRLGMQPIAEASRKSTRIVIVDVDGLTAGLIVDAVSEVLRLPADAIDRPSELVTSIESECITGIGKVAGPGEEVDHLIIILDVYKTLITCSEDARMLDTLRSSVEYAEQKKAA